MATAPFDRSHTSPLAFHSNCPILYHFRDTARLVENRDFLYPPECDDPVQVRRIITRLNIAVRFGMEKLERCGYPMAKKSETMFTRFDTIHERDGHGTDGQTPHTIRSRA